MPPITRSAIGAFLTEHIHSHVVINLDNNATTQPTPQVVHSVQSALTEHWHNPSSVHRAGQAARRVVELARESLARLVNVRPKLLTFTSTGTEAIDLAIRGSLCTLPADRRVFATTPVEHSAVREIADQLRTGDESSVLTLPVDHAGRVDLARAESLLTRSVGLLSVQWVNNETGVIQPLHALASLCERRGILLHVDATQWVGKCPTNLSPTDEELLAGESDPAAGVLRCDYLTFSPHKFHGPKGVGVLVTPAAARPRPQILGTQESGRRGGTENVPGIAGAGVAAQQALDWLSNDSNIRTQQALRDEFERAVLQACKGSVVNSAGAPRIWNTTNIAFPRLEAEAILLALSERGLCVSAGAACSSGSLEPSPVLLAMGIDPKLAHGSVRFSLSRFTTKAEIDAAARITIDAVERLSLVLPN